MILYFTGTGNSRYVAKQLAELTGDDDLRDMTAAIKAGEKGDFHSEKSGKPFVFVTPTYAWRIPRIVSDFISRSRFSGRPPAYFVLTCGSSIGSAGKYARRLCEAAGLEYRGCAGIKMPENYIALFNAPDEETGDRLVRAAGRALKPVAAAIAAGRKLESRSSIAGAIESSLVNDVFYKFVISAEGFRTTEACTGCGLCAEVCPLNNISIKDEPAAPAEPAAEPAAPAGAAAGARRARPVWGDECTHCMACICRCPQEAIEYKNISVGKRRYYLP